MKKYQLIILTVLCLLIFSGCSSSQETVEEIKPKTEAKYKALTFTLNELTLNEDITEATANFSTNLPKGTHVSNASLVNPDGKEVSIIGDFTLDSSIQTINFGLPEKDTYLVDGNYSLRFNIEENGKIKATFKKDVYLDPINSTKYMIFPTTAKIPEATVPTDTTKIVEKPVEKPVEKSYEIITAGDVVQRYDALLFKRIEVKGEVTQVIKNDEYAISDNSKSYLINISDPNNYSANNLVWVEISSEPPTLIKGSKVTVRGTLEEPYTYRSVSGTNETVPYILTHSISVN